MDRETTLEPIRELFADRELSEAVAKAQSQDEALGVLVTAGANKNVSFSADSLRRLIGVLSKQERRPDGTGMPDPGMMADTHVHMSCCTECPSSAALCC